MSFLPATPWRVAIAAAITVACLLDWPHDPRSAEAHAAVIRSERPPAPSPAAVATPPPCQAETTTLAVPDRSAFRSVVVVRPGGPDDNSIPVLYLLHGYPGSPASLTGTAVGLVRAACAAGERLVVALPDGTSGDRDTEWADSVDGTLDLESFVTGPALRAVEQGHVRPASERIIGGFSMGGFGAAAIGMRHPQLYERVLSVAGYFHLDDPDHVFGSSRAGDLAHSPDHLIDPASGQRFFLVDGAQDAETLVANESQRFAALLRQQHVSVALYQPPGVHSIRVIDPVLPALLAFLTQR